MASKIVPLADRIVVKNVQADPALKASASGYSRKIVEYQRGRPGRLREFLPRSTKFPSPRIHPPP